MTSLISTPKGVSDATFRNVIAASSAAYSIKRRVPTIAEIAAHCSHTEKTISKVLVTPEFKELMRVRGFPFERGVTLTPEQIFAVNVITNPTNKKDLGAKLKQAGITYAIYRAWLKQPHFAEYVTKISEQMLGEHVQDVHTKVVEKAAGGDIQAMRLYYELTGRHDPQKQQMVDLQGVIGLLLEVITRYVTDTTALSKITQDIELILAGGTPRALEQFDMTRIIDGEVVELESTPAKPSPPANEPIGEFFSDNGVFDFKE